METHDALISRASLGALAEPAPPVAVLQRAFQAALRAPDHRLLRPWRYLTIDGAAREKLGELFLTAGLADTPAMPEVERKRLLAMPLRAPLILVAIVAPKSDPKVPEYEQILSAGAAVENLLLSLHADGFAAMWRTGWMATHPAVMSGLGMRHDELIAGFIYVGTPAVQAREPVMLAVEEFVKGWVG